VTRVEVIGPALVLIAVFMGCDDGGDGASRSVHPESEGEVVADSPTAEPPIEEAAAFDFRRVRTEPEAHEGEPRVCDVGFSDHAHPLGPREASLYPPLTSAHRAIRCEAQSGGGWLEVAFSEGADVEEVAAGKRVVLVPEMASGGLHGYVVARFVRSLGDVPSTEDPTTAPAPGTNALLDAPLAFDFGRLSAEPALSRTPRLCAVGFVSEVELVDPSTARRVGYPPGTQNRLNVKCLYEGGDAWIDLIFDPATSSRALDVVPGMSLEVDVVRPDGGFANRPIARLTDDTGNP
jgi:hypothetical protein